MNTSPDSHYPVLPPAFERAALRVAAQLSLRQAGALLGKPASTVLRWERGARPRGGDRVRYAEFLARLRRGAL